MYKRSKFNYSCRNKAGDLLLYNTYIGSKSMCKIKNDLLQEQFLSDSICDSDIIEKLVSQGVLIDESVDEDLKLVNLIHQILSPSDLRFVISVTEQCNFLCKYCYESHNNIRISEKTKKDIIDYIKYNLHKFTQLDVTWFGGEPLLALNDIYELSKEFIKICKFNRRKYTASMTTNGYLLNIDIFKKLLENRIWSYQITIDGPKNIHDKQRPTRMGHPTFETIINNLFSIKQLRNQNFHIVIRANLTNEIFDYMDEYVEIMSDLCGDDKRFSLSICYASVWSDQIDEKFKKTFIDERNLIFPLYERFLQCKKKINFVFLLNPEDGACELGRNNRYFIRPNGELHKCSIDFEEKNNIVGSFEGNKIILNNNYCEKIINPNTCSNLTNCFFAPICKGQVCHRKRTDCPDSKSQLKYILPLLDKANPFVCID